jgi:hypothetical protein
VRRPVHVVVQGDYAQIADLLARLRAVPWHVRITGLVLRASADDGETLVCELDLEGYGIEPADEG